MKLTFAGVGGAFCDQSQYQTNAVLADDGGDRPNLLIDCGGDARFSLKDCGVDLPSIGGVYVTHLHADHIGGLEWLAFCTYFGNKVRPQMFCDYSLMHRLWESSLRGGLDSIEGKVMHLTDYFDCHPLLTNESFTWGCAELTPVQTVHVMAGYQIVHSFGLMIRVGAEDIHNNVILSKKVFYTSDTQFCPHQIMKFYAMADLIFQDCETSPFKSGVHAHFDDLKSLPDKVKSKMWLMHYQYVSGADLVVWAKDNGFAGFVTRGQSFDLRSL